MIEELNEKNNRVGVVEKVLMSIGFVVARGVPVGVALVPAVPVVLNIPIYALVPVGLPTLAK
jgi:hypothetical protein